MKLHDPNFIGFDGTPQTGRVPPTLIVGGEVALSAEQESEVRHAYKLFCDANRLALGSFQMQHRVLRDGTRVRMESNNGIDTVMVWPAEGGQVTYTLRGFVFAPMAVPPATVAPKLDTTILAFVDNDTKWKPFVSPYRPGTKRGALKYYVAGTAWDGRQARIGRAGYTLWANKPIRGYSAIGDAKFNDVYAMSGTVLRKNGLPALGLGVTPDGVPVAFVDGTQIKPVFASDTKVQGVVSVAGVPTIQVAYDFGPYFAPASPEVLFGPSLALLEGASKKAAFLGYNKKSNGVVQFWTASVPLIADAPFISAPFQNASQIDIPAVLNSYAVAVDTPTAIVMPAIINSATRIVDFGYTGPDAVYTLDIITGDPIVSGTAINRDFVQTFSDPLAFDLNDSEQVSIARSVAIDTHEVLTNATAYRTWPYADPLLAYPGPFDAYGEFPASFGGPNIVQGQAMGSMQDCAVTGITHSDVSTCSVTVPGLPLLIWQVDVTHTLSENDSSITEHPPLNPPAPGEYLTGSPAGRTATYVLVPNWSRSNEVTTSNASTENFTLDAYARDYFYADRKNAVYGWIETHITSNSSNVNGAGATGSSAIEVTLHLKGGALDYSQLLHSHSFGIPLVISTQTPWGFSSGPHFHAPPRPAPIFAPLWQEQGMCPYVAYTVTGEPGARIAVALRLQVLQTDVPPGYTPAIFPNTAAFQPYMFEQMLSFYTAAWGTGATDAWNALLGAPLLVDQAAPDATLFTNLFGTFDDTTEYALMYRT